MNRSSIAVFSCLVIAACTNPVSNRKANFVPVFSIAQLADSEKKYTCKQIPEPYVEELVFPSKYQGSDSARDQLNKQSEQVYKQQTEIIGKFEKGLSRISMDLVAEKYQTSQVAQCMVDWVYAWAEADALLGTSRNHTGASVRKWALASAASNYLNVQQLAITVPAAQQKEINRWFDKLAGQVVAEWSDRPERKVNNHDYWAAWAVMGSALILKRQDYYQWAKVKYAEAMSQLTSEGLLPNELKRQTRALSYHNYALIPLIFVAEAAANNGDDLYGEPGKGIHLLVEQVMSGLEDPGYFGEMASAKQNTDGLYTSYSLAWMPVYQQHFKNQKIQQYLEEYGPMKSSRVGGNISALVSISQR